MYNFTPYSALAGGVLIGLSAALLMLFIGRIAGISGLLAGVLLPERDKAYWPFFFLTGLVISPAVIYLAGFKPPELDIDTPIPVLIIAGLLVGYGSRLGSGCTSGHAVCGIARLSPRSLTATGIFMLTAGITVYGMHYLRGY